MLPVYLHAAAKESEEAKRTFEMTVADVRARAAHDLAEAQSAAVREREALEELSEAGRVGR